MPMVVAAAAAAAAAVVAGGGSTHGAEAEVHFGLPVKSEFHLEKKIKSRDSHRNFLFDLKIGIFSAYHLNGKIEALTISLSSQSLIRGPW